MLSVLLCEEIGASLFLSLAIRLLSKFVSAHESYEPSKIVVSWLVDILADLDLI